MFSLLYLRAVEEGKKYCYVFKLFSLDVAVELTNVQIHMFWNVTLSHLCVLRGSSQVLEAEDS